MGTTTGLGGEIVTRKIKEWVDEFCFVTRQLESNLPHGGVKYIRKESTIYYYVSNC